MSAKREYEDSKLFFKMTVDGSTELLRHINEYCEHFPMHAKHVADAKTRLEWLIMLSKEEIAVFDHMIEIVEKKSVPENELNSYLIKLLDEKIGNKN